MKKITSISLAIAFALPVHAVDKYDQIVLLQDESSSKGFKSIVFNFNTPQVIAIKNNNQHHHLLLDNVKVSLSGEEKNIQSLMNKGSEAVNQYLKSSYVNYTQDADDQIHLSIIPRLNGGGIQDLGKIMLTTTKTYGIKFFNFGSQKIMPQAKTYGTNLYNFGNAHSGKIIAISSAGTGFALARYGYLNDIEAIKLQKKVDIEKIELQHEKDIEKMDYKHGIDKQNWDTRNNDTVAQIELSNKYTLDYLDRNPKNTREVTKEESQANIELNKQRQDGELKLKKEELNIKKIDIFLKNMKEEDKFDIAKKEAVKLIQEMSEES